MDNSNLREDQKQAIEQALMFVTAALRASELTDRKAAETLLGKALSRLVELTKL